MQIKFNGWNNVPFDYKTQKSWKYKFKNIVENEYSKAEVEFLVGDNPPKFITVSSLVRNVPAMNERINECSTHLERRGGHAAVVV